LSFLHEEATIKANGITHIVTYINVYTKLSIERVEVSSKGRRRNFSIFFLLRIKIIIIRLILECDTRW